MDFVEDDEGYAQERKVQDDVDDAEGDAGGVRVDALGFGFEGSEFVEVELDAYGMDALEDVDKDGD